MLWQPSRGGGGDGLDRVGVGGDGGGGGGGGVGGGGGDGEETAAEEELVQMHLLAVLHELPPSCGLLHKASLPPVSRMKQPVGIH